MAVAKGTNAGFVSAAPSADPSGGDNWTVDNAAIAYFDTSPATAATITEVGWYAAAATQAANFEVGLYAADGATVPGEAGTLLHVSRTNAKGTTEGWKKVTGLSWSISASTDYWIAVQCDNTATATPTDRDADVSTGFDSITGESTLADPFGGGAIGRGNNAIAIYALWAPAVAGNAGIMTTNPGVWGATY
jgi:hypothetical protein